MYKLFYVDTDIMSDEDYLPDIKKELKYYNKKWTSGQVPKHWIGFSYIHSKYYELYLNFHETEMKIKSDNSTNKKDKSFLGKILSIEE